MVDAHCHLYDLENFESTEGLDLIICAGAGIETSKKAVEFAQKFEVVYSTVGIHPEEGNNVDKIEFKKLLKYPKVVAVGECGLDYYEDTSEEEKEKQRELFKLNIKLAKENRLPLVVHCRSAFDDVYKILDYDRVQMHCFTGNEDQMRNCADRGWYISLGGILTFKNDRGLREVAKKVPENLLLTETDAPWLSPEPFRGEKNTPFRVKYVLESLAFARGQNLRSLEEKIEENARTLFKL